MPIDRSYKKGYELLFEQLLKKNTTGYFDEAALPSYTHSNKLMSYLFWKRIEAALCMTSNIQQQSILDFGCGGGVTFKYLHNNNCEITGCDNEHYQLAQDVCKSFNLQATIVNDLFAVESKFDQIFALDVLEHVNNLEKHLNKLKSILKDDGQIILSGPTENFLYKIGRKFAGFSGHYHVRNIYQIENCLEKIGMQRVQLKILYPLFSLFRISLWQPLRQATS